MNGYSVGIRRYLSEATLHHHDYHQIVLPNLGDLELEVAGRAGRVMPGIGAFIVAGAPHAFLAKGRNGFVVIDVPVSENNSRLADSFNRKSFFQIAPPVQGLLDYASTTLEGSRPPEAMLSRWAELLLDRLGNVPSTEMSAETLALHRATVFMRQHLSESIKVVDIAAAAGLSATRFYALFSKQYGRGPHAALVQWRVDAARQLLTGTDLPISEIAIRTGHGDQSVLTRKLSRVVGMTPAALRRAARYSAKS